MYSSSNYSWNSRFDDFNSKKAILDELTDSDLIKKAAYNPLLMLLVGQWINESAKERLFDKYLKLLSKYGEE